MIANTDREIREFVATHVSDEEIDRYRTDGYWISPPLVTTDEIAELRTAHERLWAGRHDREVASMYGFPKEHYGEHELRQLCDGFWLNETIARVVTSPLLGAIAARLMGVDAVRLWHDQVLFKPPIGDARSSAAGNVGWHQDYGHWRAVDTDTMVTAWLALQDTTVELGAVHMVPGSHQWGLIEGSNTFGNKDLDAVKQHLAAGGTGEWREVPMELKAGQASFHHSLTIHGSKANTSTEPRLSVVSHMMPGDAGYRAGRQFHPNLTLLGPTPVDGTRFDGSAFPLMWPR